MKPALSAARAVETLNYLGQYAGRRFTLSELSDAIGVSPSSLSSVLLALVDSGYVTRHPRHKTYELGPILAAVGGAALQVNPVISRAKGYMERLAGDGLECLGSVLVNGEIVILVSEGIGNKGFGYRLGQRVPFIAPLGQVFVAWSDHEATSSWLAEFPALVRPFLARGLEFTRERGFSAGLMTPTSEHVNEALLEAAGHPFDEGVHSVLKESIVSNVIQYILGDIVPDQTYRLHTLVAPVFGPDQTVVFTLGLQGFGEVVGAEIESLGSELATAARSLSRDIGGRPPRVDPMTTEAGRQAAS